jgi:spermidine synthase/tetratricopeptide (TPR) repeat protein
MVYEVAWTRTLLMVIGSSTYAFTVMLATFLIGIFLGSFICARIVDRTDRPIMWFAVAQFLLCAAGLLSVYLFNYVPYWNIAINGSLQNNSGINLLVRFLLSSAVLLPITIVLGAIFPLVVKTSTTSLEAIGKSVGTIYSANTLGAIIGAFLAGFVIIPILGAERTLVCASVINLCIGALLLWFSETKVRLKQMAVGAAALSLVLVTFAQKPIWDPIVLMCAQGQRRIQAMSGNEMAIPSFAEWQKLLHEKQKLLFWKDGACATVGVMYHVEPKNRSLLTNGHVDASDTWDMNNQVLLAGYPLVFHPEAKNVAIVGWGSGVTTGTAAAYPPLEKVTSIEIEPAVLDAAHQFDHVNLRPDLNPKSHIEINDARNYLLATNEKFDVIISEPSNPWQAGVCNLFTKQFFHVAHDRLADKGVFCLWLQFQEIAPKDVLHVLAALQSQFKYVIPMISNGCMMVLAGDSPIELNVDSANKVINSSPALKAQMHRVGIDSAIDILSSIICSPDMVPPMTQGFAPNSDDRNYLEFDVGKTYEQRLFQTDNEEMLNRNPGKPWTLVNWKDMDTKSKVTLMNEVATDTLAHGNVQRASAWVNESFATNPNGSSLAIKALIADRNNNSAESTKLLDRALSMDPANADIYLQRARLNMQKGEMEAARTDIARLLAQDKTNLEARYLLAKTYTRAGNPIILGVTHKSAEEQPEKVLQSLGDLATNKDFVAKHPDVLLVAGMANLHLKNYPLAQQQLRDYTAKFPETVLGWRALGSVLFQQGDQLGAANCWSKGLAAGEVKSAEEIQQASKLAQQNNIPDAIKILRHALEYDPANASGRALLKAIADRHGGEATALMRELQTVAGPL